MTTFLVLLLCISPVSSIIMIRNQVTLEKKFNALDSKLDTLKHDIDTLPVSNKIAQPVDIGFRGE